MADEGSLEGEVASHTWPSDKVPAATGDPFAADGELEASRARYARRLADQGGLPRLDQLTQVAARLLGSASAQVSLISDVQTVVSGVGAASGSVGRDTASDDSLCTVTVRHGAPLRIEDAAGDARVAQLPPVTSGVVSSYLGLPLVASGHVVGALCVFSAQPRAWSDDDVDLLGLLVEQVVAELEFAALQSEYEDERLVWRLAVDAGGVGAFDWDLATGQLRWDKRLLELFGLDRRTFGGTIEAFSEAVHPDDRERVDDALAAAIETCGEYVAEYRVVLPDGRIRWIGARGHALAGPDGTAVRVLGAASDTTATQDQEARVARVLESMPTAFYHLDRDWRFTYANSRALKLLGALQENLVGAVVWDLFPAAVGSDFETYYRGAVESGKPASFESYYPPPLDRWYEIRAWPTPDGLSVYFIEVTERRATQEALAAANRRAALLAEVTQTLAGTLDPEEAGSQIARLMVPELADWCIVTLVDGPDLASQASGAPRRGSDWRRGLRDVGWWHADPDLRPVVEKYRQVHLAALSNTSFVARALTTNELVVVDHDAAAAVSAVLEPGEARDACRALDPKSVVVMPLRGRDRTVGLLTVFRGKDRTSFTDDDLSVLEEASDRAGVALDNARLYGTQRVLAEQLQRSMMTAPPEPDHVEIAVRYVAAAEAAQVGGDWYDAFLQPDGATVVVIGDVVGHDTAAAAAMGQLRSILRGIAMATQAPPAQLLSQVDAAVAGLALDTTATVVVARLEQTVTEREHGLTRLRWSNAGHPPPLVITPERHDPGPHADDEHDMPGAVGSTGRAEVLWGEPNLLLGLDPDVERDETVLTLARGATVLLYTDGLVERRGQPLDVGVQKLAGVFTGLAHDDLPLEELCDVLLARMLPDQPDDDVALVAVRLHPEDRHRPSEAGPERVPPDAPAPPS